MTGGYCHHLGRLPPWLDADKKSEQVIAVTCKRSVWPVSIFFTDKTSLFEILDCSTGRFLRDAEFSGNSFHTGVCHVIDIPVVIEIDVDELRPVGKLVIFIQLFEKGHRSTSYTDVRTGVLRFCSSSWSLIVSPPWAL